MTGQIGQNAGPKCPGRRQLAHNGSAPSKRTLDLFFAMKDSVVVFRAAALVVTMFMAVLLGCKPKPSEPRRPANVPQSAVWAGGIDGGAFIVCIPSTGNEANTCTVYNESTGDVWMSGRYLLKGKQRGATASELHYQAADGRNINLDHNLILVPSTQATRH
ncbi:MAG TPA: hypothetical protein VJU82_17455 [Acidobacteriaceae bacterium]|nr:hypothetical protein [Acidobacteriaceae bacterium]